MTKSASDDKQIISSGDSINRINPTMDKTKSVMPAKSMRFNSIVTRPSFGKTTSDRTKPSIMNGKLIKKMAGQSHPAIKNPPTDGPNAADVEAKMDKIA